MQVDQLVLHKRCRQVVLQLAHEVPLAGHYGATHIPMIILASVYTEMWLSFVGQVPDARRRQAGKCHGYP